VLALGFALVAAHYYAAPNLNGAARGSPWLERDFCWSLLSALLAVGVGLHAGVGVVRTRALGSVLTQALSWLAVTILLAAAWGSSIALLTLLIAPSHAFACLRLVSLARAWRTEKLWIR
jgi:F0F1-type ATP synthase membrane subunit c/vacuolar-type H+-ATPase subunit K